MKNKPNYVRGLIFALLLGLQLISWAQEPVLKHAYTFDDGTANDQQGTAHGTLIGAEISDGKLLLKAAGQYLDLPAKAIAINEYKAITLEAYIVTQKDNAAQTMISYFGNKLSSFGVDYLFQAVVNGGASKSCISCKNEREVPWATETFTQSSPLVDDQMHYVVTTFDDKTLKFYLDGVLVDEKTNDERPKNIIANLGTQVAYLGKSGYSLDATWKGAYDAFNIYEGVLDAKTIAERAKAYLPEAVLAQATEPKKNYHTEMSVDEEEAFSSPITGKTILFAELIPFEENGNNRVDELLTFSDAPMTNWGDFSAAIRLSGISLYLDVFDENVHTHHELDALPVEIGQVYQCWIALNVLENSYSLYAKTADMNNPVLVWKDARFRKKVKEIRYWSTLHNRQYEDDVIKMKGLSEVSEIGAFPAGYIASERIPAFSIANDPVPANAVVIDNPKHGYNMHPQISLKKLVMTDETTELYFVNENRPGHWTMFKSNACIIPAGSDTSLKVIKAEGVALDGHNYHNASGRIEYKLVFPKLPEGTSHFQYGDQKTDHYWLIMNIVADPNFTQSTTVLSGYWSDVKTGDWKFAMLNETIIYQQKVWQYEPTDLQQKKGKITLKNNQEKLLLSYQVKGDQLLLSSAKGGKMTLSKTASYATAKSPSNPPAFTSPILKPDTAIISGYLHGYSEEIGSSTMKLNVPNVITGNQESVLIRVQKDGTFRTAIPVNQPQLVFMDGGLLNRRNLFLEPGKELFLVYDLTASDDLHYAGINARLNLELANHEFYPANEDYTNKIHNILNLSPEEFRDYAMSYRQKRQDELSAYVKTNKKSDRYHQLQKSEIEISITRDILHYHISSQNAERRTNPNAGNEPGFFDKYKLPTDPAFYTFITTSSVNNDINLLAGSYSNLINASIYSPMLKNAENKSFQNHKILKYPPFYNQLGSQDQALADELLKLQTAKIDDLQEFWNKNSAAINTLINTNISSLNKIREDSTIYNPILKFFMEIHDFPELSDSDKELITEAISYLKEPEFDEFLKFTKTYRTKINELLAATSSYQNEIKAIAQTSYLHDTLDISGGLYSDLIFSQNVIRNVSDEMTPIDDNILAGWKKYINSPVIYNQIVAVNEGIKAKIEANKANHLANRNETPESEADKIFEAITSKYKGKVIYVDFWATWCGPCRQSMKHQETMKLELKDENIVFLYITNPSSPLETYNNMIPNIQGEHYRVSDDEWNIISSRFNVTGIPHYLIINKKGEVIDQDAPREPEVLVPKFKQLMAE